MSLKRGKQLNKYLKTINFGLLNYDKTNEKYKNYKTELWNNIKDSMPLERSLHINIYKNKIHERATWFSMPSTLTKSSIRELKTIINSTIYQMNHQQMGKINYNLNLNEKRNFTIRFYLDNYKKINSLMKELLVYYVERFFN